MRDPVLYVHALSFSSIYDYYISILKRPLCLLQTSPFELTQQVLLCFNDLGSIVLETLRMTFFF